MATAAAVERKEEEEVLPLTERPYDVVVLGATGSAGRWVVRYLAERYKESIIPLKWAIAGRNGTKLAKLVTDTRHWLRVSSDTVRSGARGLLKKQVTFSEDHESELPPSTPSSSFNPDCLVADVSDESSLRNALGKARLVINCVGPYRFFGDAVVRVCADLGTHYVDISGEPQFMEESALRYFAQCADNGTFIINACGFDSIPSDIGQDYLSSFFLLNSGKCAEIECFVKQELPPDYVLNSATFKSALHGFSAVDEIREVRKKLKGVDWRKQRSEISRSGMKQKVKGKSTPVFWEDKMDRYCIIFPFADSAVVANSQGVSQALFYKALEDSSKSGSDDSDKKKGSEEEDKEEEASAMDDSASLVMKSESVLTEDVKRCLLQKTFSQFAVYLTFGDTMEMIKNLTMGVMMKTMGSVSMLRQLMLDYPYYFSLGIFDDGGPTDAQIDQARFESVFFGYGYSRSKVARYATTRMGKMVVAGGEGSSEEKKQDDNEDEDDLQPCDVFAADIPKSEEYDMKIKLTVSGPDAGYKGTAIMAVESALCLLEEMKAIRSGDLLKGIAPLTGGVFTPSVAFANTTLVDRLQASGITFTLEDISPRRRGPSDFAAPSSAESGGDLSEDSSFAEVKDEDLIGHVPEDASA